MTKLNKVTIEVKKENQPAKVDKRKFNTGRPVNKKSARYKRLAKQAFYADVNSKFKKDITVFGNTSFKKKFNLKYENINLFNNPLRSQTKAYVNKFIQLQNKFNFSIIEVHNRPSYINLLKKKLIIKY